MLTALAAAVAVTQPASAQTMPVSLGGSALDAAPYPLNGGAGKPGYAQQRGGLSFGGPLKVPGLFDAGASSTFFFNYSGSHGSNAYDNYATVPTEAQRAGDFSALATPVQSVTSGDLINVSFTVTNQGNRDTREFRWSDRVYLSRDPSLDPGDLQVADFLRYGPLAAGASYTQSFQVQLPDGAEGRWYVIAFTDSDVYGATAVGSWPLWTMQSAHLGLPLACP